MKTLHIIVSDKVATYLQRDGYIVCGNSDYQVEFTFSSEWDAYERKIARFIWRGKSVDVEFSGNVCPVPIVANTEQLEVGVYAEDISTTTSAVIACKRSILCNSNVKSEGTVVIPEATAPNLYGETVTPTKDYINLTPQEGYDGFDEVTVNPIPDEYIVPSGDLEITENGTHDVTQYASVNVNVPSEEIPDHTDSDFALHYSNTGSGELGVVYSSTEKVAFEAAPEGAEIDNFYDPNFVPKHIEKGVTIFGVTGEYEGETVEEYGGAIDVKITFTIDGTRYLAEEGMTWNEWISSSYNTAGYICSAEGDVDLVTDATAENMVLYSSGDDVYATDAIEVGAACTTIGLISFVVDGVSYRAKEGMTWSKWAVTVFNHDGYVCNTTANIVTDATTEKAVEYNDDKVKPSNAITGDAVYTTATLITFTIAGSTCYARADMTWYEWANSSYNTDGYICSGNTETDTVTDATAENIVQYNAVDVYATDALVSAAAYTTASVSTEA